MPPHLGHPNAIPVGALSAMLDSVGLYHALVDERAEAGAYDPRPRSEIDAERERLAREIASRELALERREQAARLAAEKAVLDELDERASKVLGA